MLNLSIDNSDSVKRLLKIQKKIDAIQKSPLPLGVATLITFVLGTCPRWITYFSQKRTLAQTEYVAGCVFILLLLISYYY